MIKINGTHSIPENELTITASRSSGPGGQNVNKVSTKVTLRFNVSDTAFLADDEKSRIKKKLKNIINTRGILVMHEESSRSQAANRKRVTEKFAAAIAQALKTPKKRLPTAASAAQKQKRLNEKKIRSRKKAERRRSTDRE